MQKWRVGGGRGGACYSSPREVVDAAGFRDARAAAAGVGERTLQTGDKDGNGEDRGRA